MQSLTAFQLEPVYREYVWGGRRLRPAAERTAEAWVVYEGDRIASGPLSGLTLAEAARQHGADLLGSIPTARTGVRFPLLIKLLDCANWLSLQVHPDDRLALELEGPGQYGKTEAWHFIEAQAGAEILAGVRPGVSRQALDEAIRSQTLLDSMQRLGVERGQTIFIPAGMIHALGPGLLVYEVQQTSDWTYRVYDWGRPAGPERPLHLDKSIAAAKPELEGKLLAAPATAGPDGSLSELVRCDYFILELLCAASRPLELETGGGSFHALTLIEGAAALSGQGWSLELERFQTALVPASAGAYRLEAKDSCRALRARVG
jgi:mannose-6-phosphate isomerase